MKKISGELRLRPIFLSAMAAAFGVIPMIVSGSSMWSPLAIAIAFGVVWGMVVALLVVPVIYLLWIVPSKSHHVSAKTLITVALVIGSSITANAQYNEQGLSLDYVIEQALEHNNILHISKLKVQEEHEKAQELLKLRVLEIGYIEELKTMAGIDITSRQINDELKTNPEIKPMSHYLEMGEVSNTNVRISELKVRKAGEGVEAAKRSYLPDFGIMAGYSYQNSLKILPETNPFIGASLSWNIQDAIGNRHVVKQRRLQFEQAEEHREYIYHKVSAEIEDSYRQLQEANELISVAAEAMNYQKENLDIEKNRHKAGLNTLVDVLNAEAEYAKAEADYYSAMVNYSIKLSDLLLLTSSRQ